MSHALTGRSSDAPVTATLPPPYGFISYETTGTSVVMWNELPIPVPLTIALVPSALAIGHCGAPPEPPPRNKMATWPAGSAPLYAAYVMF